MQNQWVELNQFKSTAVWQWLELERLVRGGTGGKCLEQESRQRCHPYWTAVL